MLGTLSALMESALGLDRPIPAGDARDGALGAGPGTIELTVSGYLIGFALGQLLWGPISDRYGRRGAGADLVWCCSSSARPAARCRTVCGP